MHDILIIDKDVPFAQDLMTGLTRHDLQTVHATTLAKGVAMLHVGNFGLVLLGDDAEGKPPLNYLGTLREVPSRPEIIVLCSNRDPDAAESAIRAGAWNVLAKPINFQRVLVLAQHALEYHRTRPARCAPVSLRREGIVGNSRQLNSCLDIVAQAAASDTCVLITGETGTGKELFAQAIHANSCRARKTFVVVDCAALPETLAESMLFGHERGAFTSAESRSVGLITQADGGTLFLDEVGELPLSVQKVFLRVLEGRSYRPVGGMREMNSNFRLLAATNRDLAQMVQAGTFRSDLFFRLRGIRLELAPLRDLLDDLSDLVCHFIRRQCAHQGIACKSYAPDFMDILLQYDWPGNIRELSHAIDQAIVLAGSEPVLRQQHLARGIRASVARRQVAYRGSAPEPSPSSAREASTPDPLAQDQSGFPCLKDFRTREVEKLETRYLTALMQTCSDDIHCACKLSGLSRPRLYALLKARGINRQ